MAADGLNQLSQRSRSTLESEDPCPLFIINQGDGTTMTPIATKPRRLSLLALAACLLFAGSVQAAAATVTFGTPPWPGLTVKTEITEQLLQTLGYETRVKKLGVPFIYRDLSSNKIDAYLGGWMPTEKQMLDPLLAKDAVVNLGSNLDGAVLGLAVPDYVWESGIHSVKDLTEHADRFDKTVYGIESGSEINNSLSTAIKKNDEAMGQFHLVASSTAVMLTQVGRAISHQKPIVFMGWRPHWMNIEFNLRYLKGRQDSSIAQIESRVLTIVSNDLANNHPNVKRLLDQVHIDTETQSQWINDYSHKKGDLKKVASRWLTDHPKTVSTWLEGVTTSQGEPAVPAYRQAFDSSD